jgi:hypothetical protein
VAALEALGTATEHVEMEHRVVAEQTDQLKVLVLDTKVVKELPVKDIQVELE